MSIWPVNLCASSPFPPGMSRWPRTLARARAPGTPCARQRPPPRESRRHLRIHTGVVDGNLCARAISKNSSAGVFRAPSESVMNARARAIHEPERPFPTAHSAGSVICNICSGMNSPAPGVEGLPTRRPVQLPTPEHLHRVLQVIGILRVRQWPPAPAPGQRMARVIPSPLSDATPARTR